MKFHRSLTATLIAGATALTLAACGDDGEGTDESTSTTTTSASEVAAFPTAMELNDIPTRTCRSRRRPPPSKTVRRPRSFST